MAIATRDVISVPPTQSIISAVGTMTDCGFRRLPVTDAGTKKLRGIITSGDVINLMGGGDKYKLVRVRHQGNLSAAVNESVRTIMTAEPEALPHDAHVIDALEIIVKKKIGGLPIVDNDGVLVGIVTERDVLRVLAAEHSPLFVEDVMSSTLRVTAPDSPIATVTQDMTKFQFRRLAGRERRCALWHHHRDRHHAVPGEPGSICPPHDREHRRSHGSPGADADRRRPVHHRPGKPRSMRRRGRC